MTRPEERLRALGWGAGLLQAIQDDVNVGKDLRHRAEALAWSYPTRDDLEDLLVAGEQRLPMGMASAIELAGALFLEVQCRTGLGSAELKYQAMVTLRHYPEPGEALMAADPEMHGGQVAWLRGGS